MKLFLTTTFLFIAFCGGPQVLAEKPAPGPELVWHDGAQLGLEGRGWTTDDLESPYDRLPSKAQNIVRGAVWNLSRHSAGLCFRFNTDATKFTIKYSLGSSRIAMAHMPATGVSGIDLYALAPDGKWRWVNVSRPSGQEVEFKLEGLDAGKRTYMAYLPLYNQVTKLEVGIPKGNVFEPVAPRREKPILFYGTSITHGASASRPGMAHPAILGRRLDRPVINLGFSGNGKMEPEVGALLAELNPEVYVIDCLPNMTESEVVENAEALVQIIRVSRPETPIVLVEDRTYANSWIHISKRLRHEGSRGAQLKAFDNLVSSGVKNIYYLEGENLLGEDGEGTTDGSHPNDLGFMRQADAMEPLLTRILATEK
ncbi:MAG: SGNH/GDSL hydrolase family protein [Verrucomicrobiales bacterium]|nr:SGNH/GDSL hydrolase family protein [Verrucomicrobiales bacterium]